MDEATIDVKPCEFYPKKAFQSDDGTYTVPFMLLSGEGPLYRGHTSEGIIILTDYRLYHTEGTFINIPLGLIDYIECRDILYIYIYCKDARTFRCIFDSNDYTQRWLKRLQNALKIPEKVDNTFGFIFYSWAREEQKESVVSQPPPLCDVKDSAVMDIAAEAERMGFDLKNVWKISRVNEDYQLCPSYPRYIIVPTSIHDDHLRDLASFRYSRRIPAVVWRHQQNGCVIARSSQPRMGILSWRNANDEKLIQAISDACISDPGYEVRVNGKEESYSLKSDVDGDISIFCGQSQDEKPVQKKLLIVDARSYAAAMTNRAKGGGYECDGYYSNCEIQYMGLANIHTIRSSFACVRALCAAPDDQNWLSSLENTKWLHHIAGLIRAALLIVDAVDMEKRPVLVHCSDGWDRTPQIVALAEIMLDPYYRTKKGFQVLIEREWLEFGHKFADRCGHSDCTDDRNERSPVFLQWLDCVYQLLEQFQCHFEFNQQYLARLALHTYSCLFGTFLFNTDQNRRIHRVSQRTFSVWPILNEKSQFHNYLFNHSTEVLRPSWQIRNLKFWSDVYLPNNPVNLGKSTLPPVEEEYIEKTNLVKTKSCDNIPSAEHSLSLQRRNSDPNIVENSFGEAVNYPQIPELVEKVVTSAPSSIVTENSLLNMCNGFCTEDKEIIDSFVERTEMTKFPIKDLPSNMCMVLKEPTIDGSTDTLVSENGVVSEHKKELISKEICDAFSNLKLACSVSTSTSDLPLTVEDVLQSVTQNISYLDTRLPNWCQNLIGAYICNKRNSDSSNSCSCSYTTPNHSRTPSSGFPATPCDDPSDMPTLKNASIHQTLDVDGLNIVPNAVQERIKKLILHYKNKVANLQCELSSARCEFLDHLCRYYGKDGHGVDADDAPSLADSACSGEQPAESAGSESSWVSYDQLSMELQTV